MQHGDEEEHECLSENGDCVQRDTYFTLSSPKPKSSRSSRYQNWFLPSLKCPFRMSECRISFDLRHKDDRMSLLWLCPFVENKIIKHRLTNISVIELALVGMVFWICLYTACLVLILLRTHLFVKLAILAFTFPHYYCLFMATRGIWRSEPNDLKPLLAFNVTVIVIGIAFSIVFSLLLLVHSPQLSYAIVLDLWMPLFVVFVISVQKFLWDANYEAYFVMLKNVELCRSRVTRTSMVDFIKSSYLCNSALQKTNNDAQSHAYAEKNYKDNRAIEPLENDLEELEHNASDLYLGYTSGNLHLQEHFCDNFRSDVTEGSAGINFVIIPASNLLDDFRKGLLPGLQLKHIKSNVVDFARDQDGSRFVQDKLGHASEEVKQMIFYELYPYAYSLMSNMFGNHIVQKYLKEGSSEQKRYLVKQMKGNVITLAQDMYGCYVLQKAIEFSDAEEQDALFAEMKGNIMKLVVDKQGNHAIQKIVECIDSSRWQFILDVFVDKQYDRVRLMSIHPYGCRVIQCILQCCKPKQKRPIIDQLHKNIHSLVTDQYGNYVIQQVLECSSRKDKKRIIHEMKGKVLTYSLQRSASHVVEKCLRHGSVNDKRDLIVEVCSQKSQVNSLVRMMKDSCANYVIQTMLDVADKESHKQLMAVIKKNINELRQNEHAKHIVNNWFLECWNAEWELKQNSVTSATFYNLIANKPSWICFIQDPQQWQTNVAAILSESCLITHHDTVPKKAKFKTHVDVGQQIVSNQMSRATPSIARWRKDHFRKDHLRRLVVEPVCVDFIRDILIRMNPITGQVSTRVLQQRVTEALSPSEVPPLCDGLGSSFPSALQPLVDFKQYAEGDDEEPHYATPDEVYAECNHEHANQESELPSNSPTDNQLSKSTDDLKESSELVDYARRLENASKMFSATKIEHYTGNSDCEFNVQSTRHYYQIANVEIHHVEIGEDKYERTRHYCANLAKSLAKCRSLGSLQDMA